MRLGSAVASAAVEQSENIWPKYAIRLRDLHDWHNVTARCFKCALT